MNWIAIALLPPLFSALANHVDKILVDKYIRSRGVGGLVIFSALFSVVTLPIIWTIEPTVVNIGWSTGVLLALNDFLAIAAILCYFYALTYDEATLVVPYYQTIPIFAFILGYVFLGETLTSQQLFAGGLILLGALVLSFNIGARVSLRLRVALLMITASLLFAINGVFFKIIAEDAGFWVGTFWGFVGKVIAGILLLLFVRSYRRDFIYLLNGNTAKILLFVIVSESLFILAESITQYALLLAPVALVLLLNAFQPFFVFIIGIILTFTLPRLVHESTNTLALVHKIIAIALLFYGTILISI